jgi:F420-dependent oxidoreductase-like protein
MRFGIKTSPQHTEWSDILDVWREADAMEIWESAWLFDHFYPIFSDSTGPCLEGWTALAALAQATQRIRVGVLVTGNVYRHPAVLANMAATVDIVSGGRLELGIGAGWNEEECTAYGIELPPLRERFDRFDEALEVIVGLLSNTTTDFAGEHYSLQAARCEPKPVQRPHPPICIGGTGEKRTLRSVARVAQHWNHPGGSPKDIAQKLDVLKGHCAEVGRDPADILVSTHMRAEPGEDPRALAEQAVALEEVGVQLGIIYLPVPHSPAILEPLAEALRDVRS